MIDLGDDPAAQVSALASKQVDLLHLAEATVLPALERIAHARMYRVDSSLTAVARMQPVKPFDDERVRQALRYAIDSPEILAVSARGLGLPGEHHHAAPIHPDYASIEPMRRDVAKAKTLLAAAGYPNGIDLEIACKPQPSWELAEVQAMVEQWKLAGIRVRINLMPSTQYWEVWTKVPFGFTGWLHRPLATMTLTLAYRTGAVWNESKYSNPEFDALLSEAERTIDLGQRRAIMGKIERLMQDDGPIVLPVWHTVFTFGDKRLRGFEMHPSTYIFGHTIAVSG
jgi:peptide/nickel transport system substrate-binding protein